MTSTEFTTFLVVMMRVGAMMATFPVFSAPAFPARVRIILTLGLAAFTVPTLPPVSLTAMGFSTLLILLITESLIGLLFGFIARMGFYAVEIAGTIISSEMGLSLSPSYNPLNAGRSDITTLLLYYLAAILFLTLDLHHWLLAGLQRTYEVLPLGIANLPSELFHRIVRQTAQVFASALQMSAPLIATSFLVSLLFSLLGRAVPQMNVFAESFGVRLLAGLAVFGLTLNLMSQHILNYLKRLPDDILRVAQMMATG